MPLVAVWIDHQPLYTYSLLLAMGLLIAVAGLAWSGRRRGWPAALVLEVLAWALVPAVLGGRLAYLLTLGPDSASGPWLLRQPWGEGLSLPWALLAGALGLLGLAAWRRLSFRALAAAIGPGLALGQALGWLGAAIHGAVAGRPMPITAGWAPHLRDLYGLVVPRFPLQYLACALSLATWALLVRCPWRSDRARLGLYALLTGWGMFGLDWGRAGRLPLLAGLSTDQLGYLALGLAGLAALLAGWRRSVPALRRAAA